MDLNYTFRVYIRRHKADGTAAAVFVYWDTTNRGNALLDPYIYEHAAHSDLEGRIFLTRINDGKDLTSKYLWGCFTHDDRRVPEALEILTREHRPEFQAFFAACHDRMFNYPDKPFRAVLPLCGI